MNLVISTGRVGQVTSRNAPDGTPVTGVSVAMNKTWKDKDGKRQERTTWIRWSFWGKPAEIAAQILNTGDLVTITGELTDPSVYQDKTGKYVACIEGRGDEIEKLSKKGEHGDGSNGAEPQRTANVPAQATEAEAGQIDMSSNGAPF